MSKSATASMAIDVMSLVNSEDLVSDCEVIADVPEFVEYLKKPPLDHGRLTREKIVLYIALMYSVDSILNRKQQATSQKDRKRKAALMLDFPKKQGKGDMFIDYVEKYVFELRGQDIEKLVVGYLKSQWNYEWRIILSTENMLEEYLAMMDKKITAEKDKEEVDAVQKKAKIREEVQKMAKDLKKLYETVFKDQDVKGAYRRERRRLEDVAILKR